MGKTTNETSQNSFLYAFCLTSSTILWILPPTCARRKRLNAFSSYSTPDLVSHFCNNFPASFCAPIYQFSQKTSILAFCGGASSVPKPVNYLVTQPSPISRSSVRDSVFSLWCWLQCVLDVAGVDRGATLLCAGCTYQSFGFPHPNGLAIEPQFMGNILIAPTLLALWCIKSKLISPKDTKLKVLLVAISFFLCATLFLTFSRGAIYAFGIGLLVMIIWGICQKRFRPSHIIIPVCAFVLTLCVQGIMATASPTHENIQTEATKT